MDGEPLRSFSVFCLLAKAPWARPSAAALPAEPLAPHRSLAL